MKDFSDVLSQEMNQGGAQEESFLDSLLQQAQEGEKLIDPRVGKYEEAVVTGVQSERSENGFRVEMTWGGFMDQNGQPFEYTDRLYCPDQDTHDFLKARFMQKLKALGVIPEKYPNVIYCNTESACEMLKQGVEQKCLGQTFPVEIKQDKNSYTNLTVRRRKKQS